MTIPLRLGAPGIYRQPPRAVPRLDLPRMDVCAFVGVAPRGPAREPILDETWTFQQPCVEPDRPRQRSVPVPVESFQEYRRIFGGFEGPGRLPFAVASYFEQGGQRAYIVRCVHDYGNAHPDNAQGVASGVLDDGTATAGTFLLHARNEGSWGDALRASLGFSLLPISFDVAASGIGRILLDEDRPFPEGTLLRLRCGGTTVFRHLQETRREPLSDRPGVQLAATLEPPLPAAAEAADIVAGDLLISDGAGHEERHRQLGLSRRHPRWMGTVLCYESELVYPDPSWVESDVQPLPEESERLPRTPSLPVLPVAAAPQFSGGEDRYDDLVPADFFDDRWVSGDHQPGDGLMALTQLDDLASVVVPDLYSPEPLPAVEDVLDEPPRAGPTFARCLDTEPAIAEQSTPPATLPGLLLDPQRDFDQIISLQQRVVVVAEQLSRFVVLLDVPPGLTHRRLLQWRSQFRSTYAAAYHPWLLVSRGDDRREGLVRINPAAAAAGIMARHEIAFGLPHGPANAVVASVVDVEDAVSADRHDDLHQLGINVFLPAHDGIRLTAGRTLSRDPRYRQLTVRRLVLMLRRVLKQQMQGMTFEVNNASLWADVRHQVGNFLRTLYQAGAFTGASEEEAFFVRCDGQLNTPRVIDAGQLLAEVGIAPSEPIEFIVLRISAEADRTVFLES